MEIVSLCGFDGKRGRDRSTLSGLFIMVNTDGDGDICTHENICKYCILLKTTLMSEQVFIYFTSFGFYLHMFIFTQSAEPNKPLALVNSAKPARRSLSSLLHSPLLPLPIFISLHLLWSSGVISQTKCLSAHKGSWLICFNASICQVSCLWLRGVWKGSWAS